MAITVKVKNTRGFALLVAVIFMSVMLSFGLSLGSLAYKQTVLTASAIESQYAFYVADSALECALLADKDVRYAIPTEEPPLYDPAEEPKPNCRPGAQVFYEEYTWSSPTEWSVFTRIGYDSGNHCA